MTHVIITIHLNVYTKIKTLAVYRSTAYFMENLLLSIYLLSSIACLAETFKLSSRIHRMKVSENRKCALIGALLVITFTPVFNTYMVVDAFINKQK